MTTMSVSDLRAHLRDALDRVEKGDRIDITRDGRVVAVLAHPSLLRPKRVTKAILGAEFLRQRLEDARKRPLAETPEGPGLSVERAEEIVRWIHEARERRS
jgi:antitoxin (DNA-binding transcriptional repressor) of toxin-antitoxin stability system